MPGWPLITLKSHPIPAFPTKFQCTSGSVVAIFHSSYSQSILQAAEFAHVAKATPELMLMPLPLRQHHWAHTCSWSWSENGVVEKQSSILTRSLDNNRSYRCLTISWLTATAWLTPMAIYNNDGSQCMPNQHRSAEISDEANLTKVWRMEKSMANGDGLDPKNFTNAHVVPSALCRPMIGEPIPDLMSCCGHPIMEDMIWAEHPLVWSGSPECHNMHVGHSQSLTIRYWMQTIPMSYIAIPCGHIRTYLFPMFKRSVAEFGDGPKTDIWSTPGWLSNVILYNGWYYYQPLIIQYCT